MAFEIDIPYFHGPFDLLLFFIERDELDIKDIPINQITKDFLDYLRHLEQMEMEVASEFILVAATLMQIKAKMLLPRPELDETGQEIDPRDELIKHLLEYKKYKSVVQAFSDLELNRSLLEKRGNIEEELKQLAKNTDQDAELQDLDLYKLLKVFTKVIGRYEQDKQKPTHTIMPYPYTMDEQKQYVLRRVQKQGKVSFEELMLEQPGRILAIFNFLSILELLQSKELSCIVGEGFNHFWITPWKALEVDLA